jgi:hypothetical protein
MRKLTLLAVALALSACAASKPTDFTVIPHGPTPAAPRDAAHAMCMPKADIAGEQAAMVQQSMQGGFSAYGRPAFVVGAAVGHALGSAVSVALARARARDLVLAECMSQHGYMKTPKQ